MGLLAKFAGALSRSTPTPKPAAVKQKRHYSGVAIVPRGDNCCRAAREMAGKRFLSKDAPRLPLPECDQQECNCRYQHYTDRRTDTRRDNDIGVGTTCDMFYKDCRRTNSNGRRQSD